MVIDLRTFDGFGSACSKLPFQRAGLSPVRYLLSMWLPTQGRRDRYVAGRGSQSRLRCPDRLEHGRRRAVAQCSRSSARQSSGWRSASDASVLVIAELVSLGLVREARGFVKGELPRYRDTQGVALSAPGGDGCGTLIRP